LSKSYEIKKNIFPIEHNMSYKYHTSVNIRYILDTEHAIYKACRES